MDLHRREPNGEWPGSSVDSARESLLRRIPWRPGVYGFLAGVIASLLPVLFGEIVEASAMLVLGTYGLVLGYVLRWWFARSARREGRAGRLLRQLTAGTLLGFAMLQTLLFLEGGPTTVASTTVVDYVGLLIVGLFVGGLPALLVWAWSEKEGLRSPLPWWVIRGLASGVLGFVLSCLAAAAMFQVNFAISSLDWSEPLWLITLLPAEAPVFVFWAIGNPVLLALAVGADQRRQATGPPKPAAVPLASSPRPPATPAGPGFHEAVPGLA